MDKVKVGLCNEALALICASRIQQLDEHTTEARACREAFGRVLGELLRAANWIFARRFKALALKEKSDAGFVYAKLADCALMIKVVSGETYMPVEYKLYGTEIYCYADKAWLEYISADFDLNSMDAYFKSALIHALAASICRELTADAQLGAAMYQLYMQYLAEARQKNVMEDRPKRADINPYVDCR